MPGEEKGATKKPAGCVSKERVLVYEKRIGC
jgi:hypothetical protein